MIFEIDVSGEDILTKDYVVCITDNNNIVKGFKFDEKIINSLNLNYVRGLYKYKKSKKGKSLFKVRLYSIVIYHLFKSLKLDKEVSLTVCRDFSGRENDIKNNLKFFLSRVLTLKINDEINFTKLGKDSNAHKYAYLMRHDEKDKMKTYIKLTLEDFEKWLKR